LAIIIDNYNNVKRCARSQPHHATTRT